MTEKAGDQSRSKGKGQNRRARLAQQLRDNLQKRKDLTRARKRAATVAGAEGVREPGQGACSGNGAQDQEKGP